jgi:hypothetical protein
MLAFRSLSGACQFFHELPHLALGLIGPTDVAGVNRGMPLGAEGSLSANEVYVVTAYLLFLNKVIPEDLVLDKETLPKVKMPIGDDYARLPEWQHGTPRLKGYPY